MTMDHQIIQNYMLNAEELSDVTQTIISTLAQNKLPSKNPIAVIVGGQPGAGKTALINYTKQLSTTRQFITIDNDFFRNFHPRAAEIKSNYPNLFREATDQLGMEITSTIIDYFCQNKFDIILHQTLKNNRVGDDAITNLKNQGYTVGVRAFAVPFYESSLSQIERYLGQAETLGYCRYATKEGHSTAYLGLPNTIEYLEQNGLYDFLQVYRRSDDIANPTLVYTQINPQTEQQTLEALKDCENGPRCTQHNGFLDAKDAVLKTRYQHAVELQDTIYGRINSAQKNPYNNAEIQSRIDELNSTLLVMRASNNLKVQATIARSMPAHSQTEEMCEYVNQVEQANLLPIQTFETASGINSASNATDVTQQ